MIVTMVAIVASPVPLAAGLTLIAATVPALVATVVLSLTMEDVLDLRRRLAPALRPAATLLALLPVLVDEGRERALAAKRPALALAATTLPLSALTLDALTLALALTATTLSLSLSLSALAATALALGALALAALLTALALLVAPAGEVLSLGGRAGQEGRRRGGHQKAFHAFAPMGGAIKGAIDPTIARGT